MLNILKNKLTAAFKPFQLEIVDESHKHIGHTGSRPGGNTHFFICMTSHIFTSLSRIERHRMVHDVLKEELASTIHALSLDLKSPTEIH